MQKAGTRLLHKRQSAENDGVIKMKIKKARETESQNHFSIFYDGNWYWFGWDFPLDGEVLYWMGKPEPTIHFLYL